MMTMMASTMMVAGLIMHDDDDEDDDGDGEYDDVVDDVGDDGCERDDVGNEVSDANRGV